MSDNEYIFNNNEYSDGMVDNVKDISPGSVIRVYPYEFKSTSKERRFIETGALSLVSISQDRFIGDNNNNLNYDENEKAYYFEVQGSISNSGVINTTNYGQSYVNQVNFTASSNYYYQTQQDKVFIGKSPNGSNIEILPAMFSIGAPIDISGFNDGKAQVFVALNVVEAKAGNINENILDDRGLYEIDFLDVRFLIEQFENSKLVLTTEIDYNKNLKNLNGKNGISLEIENYSLLGQIKAKGFVNGTKTNISLISETNLTPFKFSTIGINDQVSLFADWFDYKVAFPLVEAKKFKAGLTIEEFVLNGESSTPEYQADINLVKDMLAIGIAYKTAFSFAPRITSGTDTGKIKPEITIGFLGNEEAKKIKVIALENKDPIAVIDGIMQDHINKFPNFTGSIREKRVRTLITALSKFIPSSYAIGKGINSFNEVYLPWYLDVFTSEKVSGSTTSENTPMILVKDPDTSKFPNNYVLGTSDASGKNKFVIQTQFFKNDYSNEVFSKPTNELVIPDNINVSKLKLIETDRKLTYPEVQPVINEVNKFTLPGDININDNSSLENLWYLPIDSQDKFEYLFLNAESIIIDKPVGSKYFYEIPTSFLPLGKISIQESDIRKYVLDNNPGTTISGSFLVNTNSSYGKTYYREQGEIISTMAPIEDSRAKEEILKLNPSWESDAVTITRNNSAEWYTKPGGILIFKGRRWDFDYSVKQIKVNNNNEIELTVDVPSEIEVKTYDDRQVIFDKDTWINFLNTFIDQNKQPLINPYDTTIINLKNANDRVIEELEELNVYNLWGNKITLYFNNFTLDLPTINNLDESIVLNKIIFV